MRWLILFLAACSVGPPGPGIDVDRALAHTAQLVGIGPRPGDSAQAKDAAAYIAGQLEVIGVPAEPFDVGGVDLPAIEVLGVTWRRAHHVDTTDQDLIVRFGGPGRALLVMAHYDTVPGSPGAVDNAAAVGVLLELARVLHEHPPPQPVMLAFTANEEPGCIGSEPLAGKLGSQVEFAIALDLIGGSGQLTLNGASLLIGRAELRWLADAADRAGVALSAPLPHRVISRWWPQAERSDHGPFTRHGIRAIQFYDRGQDGERIDLAYHSPRDVLARVDRASIDEIGRMLRALVAAPPPPHDGDGVWLGIVAPRWPLVALELVLAAVALLALIPRGGPPVHGWGLAAGVACYVLAAGLAFGVERLAAGDHPAPWLHAPLRAELAEAAILIGALGLLARLLARRAPWIGHRRYLAVAVGMLLAPGSALLALGAAELAWIWLVPAALAALAPRLGRLAPLALLATLLPAVLVISPDLLREAAWNGFLPPSLPLALWVAALLAPPIAAAAWWRRGRTAAGPLGSLVLALGCALAVFGGIVVISLTHPRCTAAEFHQFRLACEQVRTWP